MSCSSHHHMYTVARQMQDLSWEEMKKTEQKQMLVTRERDYNYLISDQ